MISYNQEYFESSNYRNYTRGRYRIWHWVKYLWIGFWLKLLGYRRIMDFGCADGVSIAAFRLLGLEAWGCDVSSYAINKSPLWVRKYLWVGDVEKKKFLNKYFDCILSFDVFEHLSTQDLRRVGKYMAKIGRRGIWGIYVTDELIARIHKRIGKKHPDHLNEHNSIWWEKWLKNQGYVAKHLFGSRKGTYLVNLV